MSDDGEPFPDEPPSEIPIPEEPLSEGPPELETDTDEDALSDELLEAGVSKELVDDLTALVDESDTSTVPPPTEGLFAESSVDADVIEQIEVDRDTAERLLKIVYRKLNEFQVEHGQLPDQLILGLPQFKAIEAYTWDSEEEAAAERLPVDEVLVVPGPQIHCVRDPYAMIEQSLQEDADDSG